MAIDLNTLPCEESEEPSVACKRTPSSGLDIDLNTVPGEGNEEPLPNLNEELREDDDGYELLYLQEDQLHLIQEPQVQQPRGQSHYLQEKQHGCLHAIDLNIPAFEGQEEESHEGNASLSSITKRRK
jgi:hypothetical protein